MPDTIIIAPSPPDRQVEPATPVCPLICERCLQPVLAHDLSGYAFREGDILHIRCLTAELEQSR